MIYLDFSATTKTNDEVIDSFVKTTKEYFANPNSHHLLGLKAKNLIDEATKKIAELFKVKPNEIIYTSGSSESNNMAIKGICGKYSNRGKHIITSTLEHSSVIAPISFLQNNGYEVDFVKLNEFGLVDLEDLEKLIRKDTILVSIASVNSEVGISQDIDSIGKIIKGKNPMTFFHCDITQSVGKEKLFLDNVDLASFSAQKFYGIRGIGGLIKKEKIQIEPLIHGGKSTTIYRSGTPATGLIVSMAKALRLVYQEMDKKNNYVKELSLYLKEELKKIDKVHINSNKYSIAHIVNISVKGIKPETLLHALEEKDIYISTQTACSASTNSASEAVYAVTLDENFAKHSVRISLSYLTTKKEIDIFLKELKDIINRLGELG